MFYFLIADNQYFVFIRDIKWTDKSYSIEGNRCKRLLGQKLNKH